MSTTTYSHTQKGPLALVLFAVACAQFVFAGVASDIPAAAISLVTAGMIVLFGAFAFLHLSVIDEGDCLVVQFGPVPIFRRRIRYADMREVAVGRTTILDGWGIHWSLRGGWVWNLWGRDCVVIRFANGATYIGTDDAECLARFLRTKLPADAQAVRHG